MLSPRNANCSAAPCASAVSDAVLCAAKLLLRLPGAVPLGVRAAAAAAAEGLPMVLLKLWCMWWLDMLRLRRGPVDSASISSSPKTCCNRVVQQQGQQGSAARLEVHAGQLTAWRETAANTAAVTQGRGGWIC
jgi:hypothetical protein